MRKTIEDGKRECKDLMDDFKKNYEEKEKKEKAENAAKFAALELIIEEVVEIQKKADKKREKDCLENAMKIQVMLKEATKEKENNKKNLENIKFEMLTDKKTMNSFEAEVEKEKEKNNLRFKCMRDFEADFGAKLIVTQIEFEARVQILTKKLEGKENLDEIAMVEKDCQKEIEALKLENVERMMRISAETRGWKISKPGMKKEQKIQRLRTKEL